MSSDINLEDLFQKWNDINTKVQEAMSNFDFPTVKGIRKDQEKIEDTVYSVLLEVAPEPIKKFLDETCNEMEIGYNAEENAFYYVMYDPEEDEDSDKLVAITINKEKKVNLIKDFEIE